MIRMEDLKLATVPDINITSDDKELKIWFPYIKPTRYVHDSGYRCFEVGYCQIKDARVTDKIVLGQCSDHIWISSFLFGSRSTTPKKEELDINMDLTKEGYIRFFSHQETLKWAEPFCLSSMSLVYGNYNPKDDKLINIFSGNN